MDQRSDFIRQDIESTRASLDEKLSSLEQKAREAFDLKHHVAERPWLVLGAAVAAGYVAGSLTSGSDSSYETTDYTTYEMYPTDRSYEQTSYSEAQSQPSRSSTVSARPIATRSSQPSFLTGFMSQFDEEIDILKTAAMSTLSNFLRESIQSYMPALGQEIDRTAKERGKEWGTPAGQTSAPAANSSNATGSSFSEANNFSSGNQERTFGEKTNF